jgi:hypothetical protein
LYWRAFDSLEQQKNFGYAIFLLTIKTNQTMKKTIRITALFLMLFATLGSCVKGDKGENGLNGTNGKDGTNGQDGLNGLNGLDGNANVHSATVVANPSDWQYDATGKYNYIGINYSAITSDIVNKGIVSVFASFSTGYYQALPYTEYFTDGTPYSMNYSYSVGHVLVYVRNGNLGGTTFSQAITFKVVAVSASQKQKHPKTNWNDYNEVQAALGNQMVETTLTPIGN